MEHIVHDQDRSCLRSLSDSCDSNLSIDDMMKRIGFRSTRQLHHSYDEKRQNVLSKIREREDELTQVCDESKRRQSAAEERKRESLQRRSFQMKQLSNTELHIQRAKYLEEERKKELERKNKEKMDEAQKRREAIHDLIRGHKHNTESGDIKDRIELARRQQEEKSQEELEKYQEKLSQAARRKEESLENIKNQMKRVMKDVEAHRKRADELEEEKKKYYGEKNSAKLVKSTVLKQKTLQERVDKARALSDVGNVLTKAKLAEREKQERLQEKLEQKHKTDVNLLKSSLVEKKVLLAKEHNELVALVRDKATQLEEQKKKDVNEKVVQKTKKAEIVKALVESYLRKSRSKGDEKSTTSEFHGSSRGYGRVPGSAGRDSNDDMLHDIIAHESRKLLAQRNESNSNYSMDDVNDLHYDERPISMGRSIYIDNPLN